MFVLDNSVSLQLRNNYSSNQTTTMITTFLAVPFTAIGMVVFGIISLIWYGIKALIENYQDKNRKIKRFYSLPIYNGYFSGTHNGFGYIDLGLPSGTLWAACNIGATNPGELGYYFMWGSTNVVENRMQTYNTPRLDFQHDAASVMWGGSWRMPTKEECEELINSCKCIAAKYYNTIGVIVIGPNQNCMFLPLTGYIYRSDMKPDSMEYEGNFWTCEQLKDDNKEDRAYSIRNRYDGKIEILDYLHKNDRLPIRPVIPAHL